MARRSKIVKRKVRRTYSENELYKRRYHKDVRDFKAWCIEHNIEYSVYDHANPDDICVLSLNEYHLHETRAQILEDEEDYFLNLEDYEIWYEEE